MARPDDAARSARETFGRIIPVMAQSRSENHVDQKQQPVAGPRKHRHYGRWMLLGLLLLLIVLGLGAWLAVNATPSWYKGLIAGKETDAEDARRVQETMSTAQTWSDTVYTHEYSKSRRTARGIPPADQLTIAFTQDQINAFLHKWWDYYGQRRVDGHTLNELFASPAVRLDDGQITIAGRVKTIAQGKVIGLHFRPMMTDQSKLHLSGAGITAGLLNVPDAIWSKTRGDLVNTMTDMLAAARQSAELDAGGAANSQAVSVLLLGLAVNALEDQPSSDILLLPLIGQGEREQALPVRLKALEIDNGQITLTVQYLSAKQRESLLAELRKSP
jgi:hypothetical protein